MVGVADLRIKIFADGADLRSMLDLYREPYIKGFTTNPTLMRKAGIADYHAFACEVLEHIPDRPISFEVFADDEATMERQARLISTWGEQVYVKIPITNTEGMPTLKLVRRLAGDGVKVNVTALMTVDQVRAVADAVAGTSPCYASLFAGRIADTGRDPLPLVRESLSIVNDAGNVELIWASPREVLNLVQADELGCHIITVTEDILKKLDTLGMDLNEFSLETVRMFRRDAQAAGFAL